MRIFQGIKRFIERFGMLFVYVIVIGFVAMLGNGVYTRDEEGVQMDRMAQAMKSMARLQPILDAGCSVKHPIYQICKKSRIRFFADHVIAVKTSSPQKDVLFIFYTERRFPGADIRNIGLSRLVGRVDASQKYYIINSPCDGLYASRTLPTAAHGGCRNISQ